MTKVLLWAAILLCAIVGGIVGSLSVNAAGLSPEETITETETIAISSTHIEPCPRP